MGSPGQTPTWGIRLTVGRAGAKHIQPPLPHSFYLEQGAYERSGKAIMDLTEDFFDTYSTTTSTSRSTQSRRKSSVIPGISIHSAIHATTSTVFQDTLISFLSYIKTQNIPILPVTKPDIRTVLGQGASFLVNGVELPRDCVDPVTGTLFPQGELLAFKRAVLNKDMGDPIADRIRVISNELLTTCHPPLRSHPNIVKLHGLRSKPRALQTL